MTTLWIVVGVVGYLAVGAGLVRLVFPDNNDSDDTTFRGLTVLLWPLLAVVVLPVAVLLALSRLAGGK